MLELSPPRRRAMIRRAVRIRCEAVADRDFRPIGSMIRDISEQGVLVSLDAYVELGEEVYLSFQAPRTRAWIDACARVVRIERGRRGSDAGSAAGLLFEEMSALDRALLAGALLRLPPPVPRRPRAPDYASAIHQIASFAHFDLPLAQLAAG